MKKIGTVDLTPTRAEHARITAYIMASHLKTSIEIFGDFRNYTELEEDAIFATWNALEKIHETYRLAGMDFWQDCPKAHKANLIVATHKGIWQKLTAQADK